MPKKKWFKPKLIIFTRSRNDELVLLNCKTGSGAPTQPAGNDGDCRVSVPPLFQL